MLEFCESWDHYSNAFQGLKWTFYDHASGFGIDPAYARTGVNGYRAGGNRVIYKDFTSKQERIVGTAFNVPGDLGGRNLVGWMDGGTMQTEIRMNAGILYATTNGVAIPGATGATLVSTSAWHYLEFRVLHHASAGEVEVLLNGIVEFSVTGVDTQATGNAYSNRLLFQENVGGTELWLDDIVVLDTVDSGIPGAPNNTFIGDVQVEALMPDANGTTSDFVGSDADSVDNYLLVDEIPPDGDTTYVESGVVGDKDTYAYEALTVASGDVFGIQAMPYVKKTDTGTRSLAVVTRESGGTEEDGTSTPLGTTYAYLFDFREADPDGNQWTIASINAAQFGQKVAA